jgi:hypothetical protein
VKKSKNGIDDDVVNDEEFDNGDYNNDNVNFDSSFDSDDEDTDVDVDDMTDNIIDDGGDNVFHSSDVDASVEEEEENDSNIQTSAKSTQKSLTHHQSADKNNNDNDKVDDDDDDDSSIAVVKSSELWSTILSSQNYHSAARASASSSSSSSSLSSSDHHNTNNDHVGVVPTLRRIAGMTIASNLEHIPPGVIGVALSESHWDTIVKYRHDFWGGSGSSSSVISNNTRAVKQQQQQQQQQQQHCHRIQQLALSENILIAIEQHPNNTHIAQSHSADVYFWRDIVNKVYPNMGGIYRPIILSYPITFVQDKLVQLGHELLELLTVPVTKEEYNNSHSCTTVDKSCTIDNNNDKNEYEDEELEEEEHKFVSNDNNNVSYIHQMKLQTQHRTKALQTVIHELQHLPMDSILLLETGIGKSMTKAVKTLKKLIKQVKIKNNHDNNKMNDDDEEMEQLLLGYPTFWKEGWGEGISNGGGSGAKEVSASLMTQLQQLLQEWKDRVSSENNINLEDSNKTSTTAMMTTTKRRIGIDDAIIGVSSSKGGMDNKVLSAKQHDIDMKLLHSSHDWRTLLQSLRTRESDMKKLHGERIRSRREDLEKHRPKIGKVVLRTTMPVGGATRKGGGVGLSSYDDREISSVGLSYHSTKRQDDILSKSRGHRARMQQLAKTTSSSSSTAGWE